MTYRLPSIKTSIDNDLRLFGKGFGSNVRFLRLRRKLTQEAFIKDLHTWGASVSLDWLRGLEQGKRGNVTVIQAFGLSKYFGVPVSRLIFEDLRASGY